MKMPFYSKLALTGIKKNSKLYIPYILTGIGIVAMFFIVSFLSCSSEVGNLRGGENIVDMLGLGSYIIVVFAAIFLFYTNSFLSRRRKKEFGLYNIMGMSKNNISKIIVLENIFLYGVSVIGGVLIGMIFSKVGELAIMHIMHGEVSYSFTFTAKPIYSSFILFAIIYVLLMINSLRQINIANPIALLHGESYGEKKPKANWFIGILGAVILGVAYYIAVTTQQPIEALMMFFVAVILVIIATYLLFISGSVLLCHILKKNKKYYYKPNHFASVSSMMFRMKRNGAGLASICILATMVLVMITGSASLYFGAEDALRGRYPYDIEAVSVVSFEASGIDEARKRSEDITNTVMQYTETNDYSETDFFSIKYSIITGMFTPENRVEFDPLSVDQNINFSKICSFCFVELEDYNRVTNNNLSLENDETYIYSLRKDSTDLSSLDFIAGPKLKIKGKVDKFFVPGDLSTNVSDACICVIKDFKTIDKLFTLADYNGDPMTQINLFNGINSDEDSDTQLKMYHEITDVIVEKHPGIPYRTDALAHEKDDFYGTFGGMFFIGIVLSLVFMFATVLIIYYKQITEGYEDCSRFEIMKKVGMNNRMIKKSINSQMLTVFFAPIIMSVVHLAFAFPMMRKLLTMFNLTNLSVILITMGITVALFAVFYAIVYKITSNTYYSIVNNSKD